MFLLTKYVWRWITALVKEVTLSLIGPKNSFSKFEVAKLAYLADIYHEDFSDDDRGIIRDQLDNYVLQVRRNASFSTCEDVQTIKIIKSKFHNKINDVWFNNLMICYTERDIFKSLDDIDIIRTFIEKKYRKGHLPCDFV
ncbi:unnamed protein product [Vicia faba]|uniref:Uncharacterized protein n=1 Tax=Vicia faba TaxID=3906 RepID=A0AAV0YY14_VICFA|nr:unnamed protein product [Vicia faba]